MSVAAQSIYTGEVQGNTHPPYLGQPLLTLHEEGQVLVRDVHVTVAAFLLVLLHGGATARERVLVDLKWHTGQLGVCANDPQ